MRGFRQFSAHLTKCHACHGICTLSPLDAALPMRFAKNTQHHTSKVLRLPRKMTLDTSKVLRLPRKLQRICACHTKRLSTHYKTRLNVTKCHACPAKRSNEKFETSKTDHLCRTYHRHGHTALTRTVGNGWGRLRPQTQRRANTPSAPRPPGWNGNPCYAFGKKGKWSSKPNIIKFQGITYFILFPEKKWEMHMADLS